MGILFPHHCIKSRASLGCLHRGRELNKLIFRTHLNTRAGFSNPVSEPEKSAVSEGFYETRSWGAECLRYYFNISSVCGQMGVCFLPPNVVLHRTGGVSLVWISTKRVSRQKKICWLISFKGFLLDCHISVISHMLVHRTWWLLSEHGLNPLR